MRACSVLQSCLTLCDLMGHILPGSSVHGILQARILEWVTISYWRSYRGSSWLRDQTLISCFSYIVDGFSTHWATWKVPLMKESFPYSFIQQSFITQLWPTMCQTFLLLLYKCTFSLSDSRVISYLEMRISLLLHLLCNFCINFCITKRCMYILQRKREK